MKFDEIDIPKAIVTIIFLFLIILMLININLGGSLFDPKDAKDGLETATKALDAVN